MARSIASAWWDMCLANWSTAVKVGETAVASNTVIGSRLGTIEAAVRNPLNGDYRELTGMVTEKTTAFSQAGMSWARDMQSIQMETFAAFAQFGAMMARGAMPSAKDVTALTARSTRIAEHAAGAVGRAFAPVHSAATANAKRLAAKRTR